MTHDEAIKCAQRWMRENYGSPKEMDEEQRNRFHENLGMLIDFLWALHPPVSSVPNATNNHSFLKEDDIRLAKEWAENLYIPWRTGDGWRAVACRLAHEVERLNRLDVAYEVGSRMAAMLAVAPNAPLGEWPSDDEIDAVVAEWKRIVATETMNKKTDS